MQIRRDPISGAMTNLPLATGGTKYGAALSNAATSGKLGSEGYRERSRNKRRRAMIDQRLNALKMKGMG